MDTMDLLTYISLALSLLLLLRVLVLQARVGELRRDLERLEGRPDSPHQKAPAASSGTIPIDPQLPYAGQGERTEPGERTELEQQTELEQRLASLLRAGKKIQAIKELRVATNLSLKEAKDQIDALQQRLHL